MSNAKRDENRITTLTTVLNTDGTTIQNVCSLASIHSLCVNDGTTGTDFGIKNAPHDENHVPVAMAISSVDGVTPVTLYSDNLLKLLIQST